MRKFLLLLCLLLSLVYASADDTPFETITSENITELELLETWGRGIIEDAIWTPDGKYLRIASTGGVWQYDVTDWSSEPVKLMDAPMYLDSAIYGKSVYRFSPDGESLNVIPKHSLTYSRPSKGVETYSLATGDTTVVDQYEGSVIYSPDGKMSATYTRDGVYVWQGEPHEKFLGFFVHKNIFQPITLLHPVQFNRDGTQLMVTTYHAIEQVHQLYLLDINLDRTITLNTSWNVSYLGPGQARFSKNNEYLVLYVENETGTPILHGDTHFEFRLQWHDNPIIALDTSPTEQIMAVLDDTYQLTVYSLPFMFEKFSVQLDGIPQENKTLQLKFSPDGRYLSLIHDEGGYVWETESYTLVYEFAGFGWEETTP